MRLVFFGTPDFAASILDHVVTETPHQVVAVVSKPDARRGRGLDVSPTPVKKTAEKLLPGVPCVQPERASSDEMVEYLRALCADLFLVVAYGEILKTQVLALPRFGCFNVHASLLPLYRGAAPIQHALMDGCSKTGISIFRMTRGMDSGDILWQGSCPVGPDMTAGELTVDLLALAKRGISESLNHIDSGTAVFVPQHHEEATLAPKLTPEDQWLDPSLDVCLLHNRIRALSPHPGAFFWVLYKDERVRLKVLRSHVCETASGWSVSGSGTDRRWGVLDDGSLSLRTSSGLLVLDIVQLEGRAKMPSNEFLRGVPLEQVLFV